ncbi:MAG TPA: ABC transporter ATP-binding protein [Thermoplasmata archaeon]|nr:ABC transporter ATP-binding protein [Thermoplasmata archaeon]
MPSAIAARGLTKEYKGSHGRRALDRVSLDVDRGEIFGLIGRNGAGKTTFLRIAGTQLLPTSGRIEVLGHDAVAHPNAVRDLVAVIPQESRPFFYATPFEHVYYYLRLRGVPSSEARRRSLETLDRLGLTKVKDLVLWKQSGGLRRRVLVAMVLASGAELLFLDEPTTGLDPLARRDVWTAVEEAAKEGRTILLTTHYLEEAQLLSQRIAILNEGKLLALGTLDELVGRVRWPFRVALTGRGFALEELATFGESAAIGDSQLVFTDQGGAEDLTRLALARGVRAVAGPVTLEDLFIQLVGGSVDEESEPTEEADA